MFNLDQLDLIYAAIDYWEAGLDGAREDSEGDRSLKSPEELLQALNDYDEQKSSCQEIKLKITNYTTEIRRYLENGR